MTAPTPRVAVMLGALLLLVFFARTSTTSASQPRQQQHHHHQHQQEPYVGLEEPEAASSRTNSVSREESAALAQEVRSMFDHTFGSYMKHAFPADELKPLACKARVPTDEPRGHLDDALGNFSLTLLDSLDTLAVMGDWRAFAEGVSNIREHVRFDSDRLVNVFETNIRALGGLLSAQQLAQAALDARPRRKVVVAGKAVAAGAQTKRVPGSTRSGEWLQSAFPPAYFDTLRWPGLKGGDSNHSRSNASATLARADADDIAVDGKEEHGSTSTGPWSASEAHADIEAHQWLREDDAQALLRLSLDLGDRILRAFDTPSGIPYSKVNLRFGMVSDPTINNNGIEETCTAGAGTLLMEMGMLSRISGDPKYEAAARRAIGALWQRRGPLGLYGNTLRVSDGHWTRPTSSIGAGVDSFFEYLIKASILLDSNPAVTAKWARNVTMGPSAEADLMHMFEEAYQSVEQHISRDGWYFDVSMHNGALTRDWVDSLQGFWPAMQVLHGDVAKAELMYEKLIDVWRHWGVIPEGFHPFSHLQNRPKYQIVQQGYPLRPELAESTLALFRATNDRRYLEYGRDIVRSLQQFCRTECGFAGLSHVMGFVEQGRVPSTAPYMDGTGGRVLPGGRRQEDRLDSYFLAETLKYLYLLFDEDHELHSDQNWLLTTEGHLAHIGLAHERALSMVPSEFIDGTSVSGVSANTHDHITAPTCPASVPRSLFSIFQSTDAGAKSILPACIPQPGRASTLPIPAPVAPTIEIVPYDGVVTDAFDDGDDPRHHRSCPRPLEITLRLTSVAARGAIVRHPAIYGEPANFGMAVPTYPERVGPAVIALAEPANACAEVSVSAPEGFFCAVERGGCSFVDKVLHCRNAGASAMLLFDVAQSDLRTMNGAGLLSHARASKDIPSIRLGFDEAQVVRALFSDQKLVSLTGVLSAPQQYVPADLSPMACEPSSMIQEPQFMLRITGVDSSIDPDQLLHWAQQQLGASGFKKFGAQHIQLLQLPKATTIARMPKAQSQESEASLFIAQALKAREQPVNGSPLCLSFTHGWWTYQVCPRSAVTQYRVNADGSQSGLSTLGKYDSSSPRMVPDPVHLSKKYFVESYSDGTKCGPSARPRKADVRYACGPTASIAAIREPRTCEYELDVTLPELCDHPFLDSKLPVPVAAAPKCVPVGV